MTAPVLHLAFLGLRGFPDVQGGVETHCAHLCPLLVQRGCAVTVLTRSGYQKTEFASGWMGVQFKQIWSPRAKGAEAIVHTLLGVLYAGLWLRPDILHIQAIGPALWTPLARLLGLRIVVTHHGPDYDRQKWGVLARTALRVGEAMGMRFSNARIVISQTIRALVQAKYGLASDLIPNGVTLATLPTSTGALATFGLTAGKYVLLVSRLVPEKRHLDLIRAFEMAGLPDWQLVLVGGSDHPDAYSNAVAAEASRVKGVVATGFQSGLALHELYAHAGVFVLPSSHEGLPIALLEALSFGLPVVASNIPANAEIGLSDDSYFELGDIAQLAARLKQRHEADSLDTANREKVRGWVSQRYDWHAIADQTLAVYQRVAA